MPSLSVHLRPFEEADLALFTRFAGDRSLSEPFSWFGFQSPESFRRRWEHDGFLGESPRFLAVANDDRVAIGCVVFGLLRGDRPIAEGSS